MLLGQEDPLEKGMATTPVFLPREFHGQRSLTGYNPWGLKESDISERLTLSLSLIRFSERNTSSRMSTSTQNQGLDVVDGKACS